MPREKMPHVLVLLPGITGSVLQRDGKDVWAPSGNAILRALMSGGQSIKQLALADDNVDDGVVATRLMPDVHLIPGFWKIDGYGQIRKSIMAAFEVTEGENYFEFAYDWRRDNRKAAALLKERADDWLLRWRQTSERGDAKLVLIAHSMGGLIARYFLEVLDGWRDTKALVTFGTPYRGAVNALNTLANGDRFGPGGILDLSDVVRSFTSAYQLLPSYPVYDPGDGHLVRVGETTGIPNIDPSRAKEALDFIHEIRDHFDAHQNDAEYRDHAYTTFPIVGIQQPTSQSARLAGNRVEILNSYEGQDFHGDGTVPRVSASPEEERVNPRDMYAATRHASLQNADAVLAHLSGVLQFLDLDLGAFRAPTVAKARLSLDIADAYTTDEPVVVRVQPDRPGLKLTARVASTTKRKAAIRAELTPRADGWHDAPIGPLSADVYRVTVAAGRRAEPASDVFAVFGPPTD